VADDPTMASTAPGLFSAASSGLDAYSSWLKGAGDQASDDYRAQRAETAAGYARLDAVQTGAALSTKLSNALGTIDAMRAAAHTDPTSPTGAAVRDTQEQIGLTQKSIAVDNKLAQARQDDSDAAYLHQAGKYALLGGELGAASGLLKSAGQALPFAMLALA
jgi:hypothetical protein